MESRLTVFLATAAFLGLVAQPLVQGTENSVSVLIDFGDGSYVWASVEIQIDGSAFNATLEAVEQLGFNISYTWFPFGVMIQDIGDRHPVFPESWHFFIWNHTSGEWDFPMLGASSLTLHDDDAIAWYLASGNPITFAAPIPSPTPLNRSPYLMFRHDTSNSGRFGANICDGDRGRWQFDTGAFEISATPAAANGRLFVETWEGLYALNENDGSLAWKRADISGMSSPAVFNQGVIVGGRDGAIHYLAASDGREHWNVALVDNTEFTGIASSPKPHRDMIYVGIFNESGGDGGLVAINVWNGSIVWRHDSPSIHMSSPAIDSDTVYVGVAGYFNASSSSFNPPFGLLAVYSANGSAKWFYETAGPVMSSPLLSDARIVFTSRDGTLHAIHLDGTYDWSADIAPSTSSAATDGTHLFIGDGTLGTSGNVTAFSLDGDMLWSMELSGPVQSSPLYVNGTVFVAINEPQGRMYALDAVTGRVSWTFIPSPSDYILSSPIAADQTLYIASDNGIVYAFGCDIDSTQTSTSFVFAILATALFIAVAIVAVASYFLRKKGP